MPRLLQSPPAKKSRPKNSAIRSPQSAIPPDRPGIATDTALMPWIIADKICEEAANYLNSPVPLRYKEHLDAKAERCYARHRQFRKLIRARGNDGRDSLSSFMRHWLAAHLHKNHPALYAKLPKCFQLGQRLPSTSPFSIFAESGNHRL
jgi:hypothetical protein